MSAQLQTYPKHWHARCYPHPCPPPPKPDPPKPTPQPQPTPKPQSIPQPRSKSTHNVLYLVDEHDITTGDGKVSRHHTALRRFVWHYPSADLATFNIGEPPDTIVLHEKISDPKTNSVFRWEGFMFDVPGSVSTVRIAIAPGAADAKNSALNVAGIEGADRIIGFAGSTNNDEPFGPIVGVRRDDKYRLLHSCDIPEKNQKVGWFCAYYITKEPAPSSFSGGLFIALGGLGGLEQEPASESAPTEIIAAAEEYDAIMEKEVDDNATVSADSKPWGGNLFGFTIATDAPTNKDDDPSSDTFAGNEIDEIKEDEKD